MCSQRRQSGKKTDLGSTVADVVRFFPFFVRSFLLSFALSLYNANRRTTVRTLPIWYPHHSICRPVTMLRRVVETDWPDRRDRWDINGLDRSASDVTHPTFELVFSTHARCWYGPNINYFLVLAASVLAFDGNSGREPFSSDSEDNFNPSWTSPRKVSLSRSSSRHRLSAISLEYGVEML